MKTPQSKGTKTSQSKGRRTLLPWPSAMSHHLFSKMADVDSTSPLCRNGCQIKLCKPHFKITCSGFSALEMDLRGVCRIMSSSSGISAGAAGAQPTSCYTKGLWNRGAPTSAPSGISTHLRPTPQHATGAIWRKPARTGAGPPGTPWDLAHRKASRRVHLWKSSFLSCKITYSRHRIS